MSDFVYREPGLVVKDILQTVMKLSEGQVMFSNQKYEIPTDGLYIVISYIGPGKVLASQTELVDKGSGVVERRSVVSYDMVSIQMMSFSNEARKRRTEIAMAINSIYAEQQAEKYAMKISRHPGAMIDTSFLEETKMVTRYECSVMTSSINIIDDDEPDYYTTFKAQLNIDPKSIPAPIEVDPIAAHP